MHEPVKPCSRCKMVKPLSAFPKSKQNKSGCGSRCNACMREIQAAYKATPEGASARKEATRKYRQSEKGQAYLRAYRQSEHGRAVIQAWDRSDKGRAVERERGRRRRASDNAQTKARFAAYAALHDAIDRGDLPRCDTLLCSHCSQPAQVYHHYLGYSKVHQLHVEPLCTACHYAVHHPRQGER